MSEIRKGLDAESAAPNGDDVCAVKQVDLTVSKTDDPTLPVLTFRMWILGVGCCVLLSFVNQFFWYRTMPLIITSISAQIAVVPLGHLMARAITERVFLKGTRLQFTLNPGPFNIKEHVMIAIFANTAAGTVYATHILSSVNLYYKKPLGFIPAFIFMITTQMLGMAWQEYSESILLSSQGNGQRQESLRRGDVLSEKLPMLCLLCVGVLQKEKKTRD